MTTSKERVLTALNHETPDRVPVDLGGRQTTLSIGAYKALKKHLGWDDLPVNIMSKVWQTVFVDERILEKFSVDCRHIRPASKVAEKSEKSDETQSEDDVFTDQWGIKRQVDGDYANIIHHPLSNSTIDDLDSFNWPDPAEDYDYSGLRAHAKKLYDEDTFALVGCMGSPGNIFEQSWYLRDFQNFLMDLAADKDFAHAMLRRVVDIRKKNADLFLKEVGEYIDVFQLADDLAMQNASLMSPALYQEMIKPYLTELIEHIKGMTNAKIYYHSCGAVVGLLDDLIEAGVEILNPVQVTATGMETDQLKKRFGDKLSFWGAIDTFKVLPGGTPKDVENEVRKRIADLSPKGGYVMGPVHNIQSDVSPENVIAMYETAQAYGSC